MLIFPIAILAITDETDREFMKELYIRYHMTMLRMARALTDSSYDAEDAVGDACVSLIKKISVLRRLDCNVLEGYIISTVKNAVYMLHRKKNARREVDDGEGILGLIADENAIPDERIILTCTIDALMKAISRLPENDQVVIRMKYFEKLTDREMADLLEIQEVSVRSRLTRARKRMYVLLGGNQNEC